MRIGIDIDGVLNDLAKFHLECGLRFCNQHQLSSEIDVSAYEVRDIFNWSERDYRQFQKEYYAVFFLTCSYLRPFASEAVRTLHQCNEIFIITARKPSLIRALNIPSYENSIFKLTQQWLSQAEIEYDHFVLTQWDKREAILDNKIDIMIEDSPLFFEQQESFPTTQLLCFDAVYNRKIVNPSIQRVHSWFDVLWLINQKG